MNIKEMDTMKFAWMTCVSLVAICCLWSCGGLRDKSVPLESGLLPGGQDTEQPWVVGSWSRSKSNLGKAKVELGLMGGELDGQEGSVLAWVWQGSYESGPDGEAALNKSGVDFPWSFSGELDVADAKPVASTESGSAGIQMGSENETQPVWILVRVQLAGESDIWVGAAGLSELDKNFTIDRYLVGAEKSSVEGFGLGNPLGGFRIKPQFEPPSVSGKVGFFFDETETYLVMTPDEEDPLAFEVKRGHPEIDRVWVWAAESSFWQRNDEASDMAGADAWYYKQGPDLCPSTANRCRYPIPSFNQSDGRVTAGKKYRLYFAIRYRRRLGNRYRLFSTASRSPKAADGETWLPEFSSILGEERFGPR